MKANVRWLAAVLAIASGLVAANLARAQNTITVENLQDFRPADFIEDEEAHGLDDSKRRSWFAFPQAGGARAEME